MARTKSEITPAQKATSAAREAHDRAKEANTKSDNATTKAALEKAKATLASAVKTENAERGKKIGAQRVKKVRAALANLAKVANPRTYELSEEQVAAIKKGVKERFDAFNNAFDNMHKTGGAASAGDDFSL